MLIDSHRLGGANVVHLESPNIGDLFPDGLPDTIVMHYTACCDAEQAVEILCNLEKEASAHLVVSKTGQIFQLVPFNTVAWHAGKSSWDGRESLNQYSIGIELDNAGKLDTVDGRYFSWSGEEYSSSEVFISESGEAWHVYSEIQLKALDDLVEALVKGYSIRTIVGHSQIAPERKSDPGSAFPMDRYQQLLKKLP